MFQMETKRMERTEIVESSDIEYPKAKLYKRWFSGLIDIILTLFMGFLLYGITALVTNYVPSYKENSQTRLKLEIESGLYDSTGNLILNTLEDSKDSYDSKKTCLSKAIDGFYSNSTFFDDDTAMNQYKGRKENAIDKDGNKLFVLDSNSNLTEGNLKAETYYDFYVYEISNYSIALLSSSDLFQTTSRVIVLTSVIEMFICFGIGYFISFNLIPMFLKRGRKTFGMYLFNLSVLTDEGLVVPFHGGRVWKEVCSQTIVDILHRIYSRYIHSLHSILGVYGYDAFIEKRSGFLRLRLRNIHYRFQE